MGASLLPFRLRASISGLAAELVSREPEERWGDVPCGCFVDVADRRNPMLESCIAGMKWRFWWRSHSPSHSTASVVTHDDDVLDTQVFDSVG